MNLLLDANVLLRIAQQRSREHLTAKSAVLALAKASIGLCVVPQVIYEFWVVATRPLEVNGLGMDVVTAEKSIQGIMEEFRLLKDERGVFGHWQSLVVEFAVKGKTAHDARIVAAMQRHGVRHLMTFNKADFTRYSGIHVSTPAEIVAGHLPG